ncbi:V-type proton ATPase subunit G 3 [Myotis lucifugus]|uniref:V-type proton ATPase subunit G n=2 Tax=Myotis TaxID=9434 RepID=G1PK05_MYOLU|nr:PREDICTED: V-type proton ATPase subunit G 3 [Myotis brandtii]XP_006107589.1 V-type proton ATPase subunit G 3 [Myotis lucifugus]EPQ19447.1 V-type proton ATPase subunit G 3 [Myotis brandtii]
MASQSQGIHQLLQAEKRAKDKLEEAKKRKAKRIRQAKEEAMVEVDQYRMQKDKEFRMKQAKAMGSQSNLAEEMEAQALERITELTGSYRRCLEGVLAQVLGLVCDVRPGLHLNYRAAD